MSLSNRAKAVAAIVPAPSGRSKLPAFPDRVAVAFSVPRLAWAARAAWASVSSNSGRSDPGTARPSSHPLPGFPSQSSVPNHQEGEATLRIMQN